MDSSQVERKLTAILSADVAGYSRLMGDDHEATLATLTEYRQLFSSIIETHHGRVVNAPGDAILAEFASVVDGVGCAAEIQRELAERNARLPEHRKMVFRIGINLGDVLVQEGSLYGDGVNIAARDLHIRHRLRPGGNPFAPGVRVPGQAKLQNINRLNDRINRKWHARICRIIPQSSSIGRIMKQNS